MWELLWAGEGRETQYIRCLEKKSNLRGEEEGSSQAEEYSHVKRHVWCVSYYLV